MPPRAQPHRQDGNSRPILSARPSFSATSVPPSIPGLAGQPGQGRATIGNMSEPDAVPLPREGEVFFDVRGDARSMRLSWYANSKVAVFSIWQGNRCTGTFRLPFVDLERMIQALRSGPTPLSTRRPAAAPYRP